MSKRETFVLHRPGDWTEEHEFPVNRDQIAEFSRATNEVEESFLEGEVASPLFAVVPIRPVIVEALAAVIPAELAARVPVLHGEHDLHIYRQIVAEMVLVTRAAVIGMNVKKSGTTLSVRIESRDREAIVNEQFLTAFLPRVIEGATAGEQAPRFRVGSELTASQPTAVVIEKTDPDQSRRYAKASGDESPFHIDDEGAQRMGFDGVIMHGLCTLAFAARAVVQRAASHDPSKLLRLAARFTSPVYPGESISTLIWKSADSDGRSTVAFESRREGGESVLKHGRADLSDG